MRVLIVEDEPLIAMDLETRLQQSDCQVIGPALSISEALAFIEENELDLALLDANLDGEAPTEIVSVLSERKVPFVYLSGYDADYVFARLPAGPMLTKPVSGEDIRELIEAHRSA